ncbi:MAG: 2-dehydro-3-deoxygalactonokinase [Alphaproteobacteria bacterium]|nr:2-dehydro-3-deoxygalactonokinase [Alphaproteobacteria bacterium]
MSEITLIGVDWGSTSVRAFAIARGGAVVNVRRTDDGVFLRSGDFGARLAALLGDWPANVPILMCGMIGSDRGWVQAPYVTAPAGLDDLAKHLVRVPFVRPAFIVPGVSLIADETCEVMRGEETIVMGLDARDALACLPGTHAKWVDVDDRRIVDFRTYMTGELRALVLGHGALATGVAQEHSHDAFAQGLDAASSGVTSGLFQARARRLLGRLAAEHTAAFVGGVLIGEELRHEARGERVTVAAQGEIASAYAAALDGRPHAIEDPERAVAKGLWRIAEAAGLC